MSWTDERVEILKKMWSEGSSASQIAKVLGGMTRNAVIGKIHRLGLASRTAGAGSSPKKATKAKTTGKTTTKATAKPSPPPTKEAPVEAPKPIPQRRMIVTATRPLPPQPSINEIPAEALERVSQVERKSKKLKLLQLTERTCKWPIGDPATEEFWFCGLPSNPGKPYCEAHVGVAFQPVTARKDRRR